MPEPALPERAARAALAAHFAPDQVAADLADYSPAEVWQRRVRRDNSGRLAQYKPREELDNATLTCPVVIPSDEVWPTALADLGPHCPLGLWVRGGDQMPQLTARSVAVTGNRNATEQAITRTHAFAAAIAEAGHTVTATLAYGVDSAAHRGPWALYHVRRLFLLSDSGKRRPVMRSTERVDLGHPQQLARRLISVSERHHVDVEHDPIYGRARSWVRRRAKAWPMAEELFATATAPARVINKQDEAFEEEWDALLSGAAAQLPLA
ncbi:DNA-processing protein DprA [Streptomyces griseoincarnatus]